MKRKRILFFFLGVLAFLVGTAIAQEHAKQETLSNSKPAPDGTLSSANSKPTDDRPSPQGKRATQASRTPKSEPSERAEGEQRFRENCGRCHQQPHKFPPRVMAAAIRHMRVRAMLTDEDMRLILKYMTQ